MKGYKMKIMKVCVIAFALSFLMSVTITFASNQTLVLPEISKIEIIDLDLTLLGTSSSLSPSSLSTHVGRTNKQRGQYVMPYLDYFAYHGAVTTTDPYDDIYFVTESENRIMALRFDSANIGCKAKLFVVDPNTMNSYDTGYEYGVGDHIIDGITHEYYWMFRVCSTVSISSTTKYMLAMNNKLLYPKSGTYFQGISIYTQDWKYLHVQYTDNSVYINDQYIHTIGSNAPNVLLEWERLWEQHNVPSLGGGYRTRLHKIYDPIVASISGPVKYESDYASSNNAIIIELGEGTGYVHWYSEYYNGGPITIDDKDPYIKRPTPRPLDSIDFLVPPLPKFPWLTNPFTLVYCLDSGKAIDFVSVMNFYYLNGIEQVYTVKPKIPYISGDVNNDGFIDVGDTMILSRWLAHWVGYVINEAAADVDTDENVTPLDLIILRRHLAEWSGYENLPYLPPISSPSMSPSAPAMPSSRSTVPAINVSSATGDVGNIVDVNISLSDNPGIIAMRLGVEFNDSVLSLIQVVDNNELGSKCHGKVYSSPYTLFWENGASTTNFDYSGDVVTLRFEILSDTLGSPVTVSYDDANFDVLDVDLNPVYFEINNGSVSTQP